MIHEAYNQLTAEEKTFVDDMMAGAIKKAKSESNLPNLRVEDTAEIAVEAVSKWVIQSRRPGENKPLGD